MRLALSGLSHETNTFSSVPADLAWFQAEGILRGEQIRATYGASRTELAGYFEASERFGFELEPLLFTYANPCGTISRGAYEAIVGEILDLLDREGPWDGVLLAQHGAAVSEDYPDADGEVVRRVRTLVGPRVPIGMVLDMHANISPAMIEGTTATVVYRTNPHLDARDRGLECAELIVRTVRGEIRPSQALAQVPAAIEINRQNTDDSPMREIVADVSEAARGPGILSVGVAEGYPWADVSEMGMSVVAIGDGSPEAARDVARRLARAAWDRRREFVGRALQAEEALTVASAAAVAPPAGPVALMDVGDNVGGGGPGDSTVLLEAARRLGIRGFLCILLDPAAVLVCAGAGEGASVEVDVGAQTDDRHGRPVRVSGIVRSLSDGRFEDPEPTHGGFRYFDAGRTAVLDTPEGQTIILTSRLVAPISLAQVTAAGVDPASYRVIAAKGVVSPQPAYRRVAKQIFLVDTPGVTANDLRLFHYRRRRRPLFPFEPETQLVMRAGEETASPLRRAL